MRKIQILGLILFSCFKSFSQGSIEDLLRKYNSGEVSYISVEELRMRQLKKEVVIFDSRTREEYLVSHLENAIFIGVTKEDTSVFDTISQETPIVVYCSLGIRSEDTAIWLQQLGFKNVNNLYGGIFKWKNKNYPVVNTEGKETEKVHGFSPEWAKWLHNAEKIY